MFKTLLLSLILAVGMNIGYKYYTDNYITKTKVITLVQDEWECTKSKEIHRSHYVDYGNMFLPWSRIENICSVYTKSNKTKKGKK